MGAGWERVTRFRVDPVDRAAGRPLYATMMNYEVDDAGAFQKHLPGHLETVGRVRAFTTWKFVLPP